MKKLFVLLMVVGLVIAGRGMASAALSWSMPDTLSVTPGSQVTVPVYMSVQDAFDLGALSLSVLYDSSKFDYVGYAQGSWNSQFVVSMGDAAVPGNFRAGDFYDPVVPLLTGDGTLLTFTLQAKTTAPLGFSALTFDPESGNNEVANGDYNAVALSLTGGSINVNAVPIPAAVWLLGSGLIGLVSIRRKFSK